MNFIKNVFAISIALIMVIGLFFLVSVGVIASLVSSDKSEVVIEENSILHLKLTGELVNKTQDDSFEDNFSELFQETTFLNNRKKISLSQLIKSIKKAKEDVNIKGIYIEPNGFSARFASLTELRDVLNDFKKSGKFLYSYATNLGEGDFYLLSVSDSLFVDPSAFIEFNGLSASINFYKGTLDKLDIKPEIFKVGKFKSAVEPFLLKKLSDENKLQLTSLLNSINNKILMDMSISLNKSTEELKSISDSMKVFLPEDALKYKIISKVSYKDEVLDLLKSKMNVKNEEELNFIKLKEYSQYIRNKKEQKLSKNQIAVIYAEGSIIPGEKFSDENITGEYFAELIRKARNNDKIKAIVLRVNSPGGSAAASDLIWRELMLVKGKKPLIVSMSDLAASGGYYISGPADKIYAMPNTLTGSIGIFGMFFDVSKLMNDRLGISQDGVNTGKFSDILTFGKPFTDGERSKIQFYINKGYENFTSKMAQNRKLDIDSLKSVAEGRVWTGEQAKAIGLVDEIGGLDDAINEAAKQAKLGDDYDIKTFPKDTPFFEKFLSEMKESTISYFFNSNSVLSPLDAEFKKLKTYQGIQARMEADIIFE